MLRLDPSAFLRNPRNKKTVTVPSETRYIRKVSTKILGALAGFALDDRRVFDVRLCVEEAVRNAIVHGNHSDRRLSVRVTYWIEDSKLFIEVEDEGSGYDHNALADPTTGAHITKNSGRGVYLIKKLMDRVSYNDTGNRIMMVKNLS
jgi:serine/threonine-protein kinase RsbW